MSMLVGVVVLRGTNFHAQFIILGVSGKGKSGTEIVHEFNSNSRMALKCETFGESKCPQKSCNMQVSVNSTHAVVVFSRKLIYLY